MKKLLVILMSLMLVLAFVGCDEKTENPSTQPSQTVSEQPSQTASVQPTQQPSASTQESATPQPSATADQSIMLGELKSVLENLGTKMAEYKSFDATMRVDVSATAMGQTQQINAGINLKMKDADGAYLMQGVISADGLMQDGSSIEINMFYDGEYMYVDMSKINGQKIKLPLAMPEMPMLPDVEETPTEDAQPETTQEPEDEDSSAIKDLLMSRLGIVKDNNSYVLSITLSGEDVKTILEAGAQDEDMAGGAQNALEGVEIKGASISFVIGLDGYLKGVSFSVGISTKSLVQNQFVDTETDLTATLTLNNTPDQEVEITLPDDLDTYIEGQLGMGGAELM